ncbi:helix-turn-helix transcriptional regulator [Streptomyces sp. SDr-06]|uniref:helix-turn-helix transcriptional regulator n=1 Tax=Streptomyces sp. SDr-06 TaxID=2267702 RepID=UPI001CB92F61|nr:LuxR C-terminal-related transcriptional regulator [Streptomyces sp. SDr-06]
MYDIGVVHEHPLIAWAVGHALSAFPDVRVHLLSAAAVALPGAPLVLPDRLDVLVLDRPPGRPHPAGIEAAAGRASCVVLLCAAATEQPCPGVSLCLPERTDPVALATAVHLAARNARLPPRAAGAAKEAGSLSVRERQVLRLLADGLTHDQAARRLGISRHTVDTYVKRIRAKLTLGNKAELVKAAMCYGWN